jgi:ElaA protein
MPTRTTKATAWQLRSFADLHVSELQALLAARSEVFVVEQQCIFQDIDGADPQALHLMAWQAGALVAYARCFPAGVKYTEASIGRVLTRLSVRGQGLGHVLIEKAREAIAQTWGEQAIRIGAQARLAHFYAQHGYRDVGQPYVEDGNDHLEMVWTP